MYEQEHSMLKSIKSNGTIGIISPSWPPQKKQLESGLNYLKSRGLNIKLGKNVGKRHGYFSGTDEERLSDIHDMFADPEIDIIMCTRGGWGGLRLINKIDYDLVRKNPKLLVGYSDITTLQLAFWTKIALPSLSGPMVGVEMGKGIAAFSEQHLWGQIYNRNPFYHFNYQQSDTSVMKPGKAQGVLLGGCLSLVCHLIGTEYSPDYSGAILFLEDVGEKPYKIDRYLAQLKQSGILNKINGLILGYFMDCTADEDEVSFHVDEILDDYFSGIAYPVIRNFPYGHGVKFSMPIGVRTVLDTERGEIIFGNPFIE